MLNQITFHQAPDGLILNPFGGEGFAMLQQPDFFWRPRPRAQIHGFAASEHPEMNEKIEAHLALTRKHCSFKQAIEVKCAPVFLRDVWFKKSFVTTGGKCLVNGASGSRLLNHYCWKN